MIYFNVFRSASYILEIGSLYLRNSSRRSPGIVLLHIGSKDINNQTNDRIDTEILTGNIISIRKSWIDLDVKEVVRSSVLPKKNIALTSLIRQVNNSLRGNSAY